MVAHSQGISRATRRNFVGIELDQIIKYQADKIEGIKPSSIEPTARIMDYIKQL
ncbi:hypothetical protein HYY72_00625 [Candidatus Woesearchaeota archaeon]|nr:hypothetical protein [Candidatus Woesearchaeota archaeon]